MNRSRKLTHSEKTSEMRARWEPFPNVTRVGSYTYFSQTIELHSIIESDVRQAFSGNDVTAELSFFPLLKHQLQHLADHIATIWGRENLISLFNAFNVRAEGKRIEFGRVTQILRELRAIHFNDYYTEYGPAAGDDWDGRPWRYDFSSGVQLGPDGDERNDCPIAFTRFDTQDGKRVVRVPFTVASLFEVRAMAAEMSAQIGIMNKLPEDDRLVEIELWKRKTMKEVYSASHAMYSTAAHYLSNIIRSNTDVVSTYQRASVIAGLCLNMPRSFFPRLKMPNLADVWGEQKHEAMKARYDRGYLYFALIANGRDIPMTDMREWLERALPAAGLPSLEELRNAIAADVQVIGADAIEGPARHRLEEVLTLGRAYYESALNRGELSVQTLDVPIPPVLIQGNKFITFKGGPRNGTFADPGAWLDEAHLYYSLMREFVDACVI